MAPGKRTNRKLGIPGTIAGNHRAAFSDNRCEVGFSESAGAGTGRRSFSGNPVFNDYQKLVFGHRVRSRSQSATILWLRTVLLLKRSVSMTKDLWRVSSTCRTLQPLTLEPLVSAALSDTTCEAPPANLIEYEVSADSSAIQSRISRR